jgi:hypothetical protein
MCRQSTVTRGRKALRFRSTLVLLLQLLYYYLVAVFTTRCGPLLFIVESITILWVRPEEPRRFSSVVFESSTVRVIAYIVASSTCARLLWLSVILLSHHGSWSLVSSIHPRQIKKCSWLLFWIGSRTHVSARASVWCPAFRHIFRLPRK